MLTSAGHERKVYELSGPQALSYGDAADSLSRVLGKPIRYVAVSDQAARAGLQSMGVPDFYIDYLLDLFRAYRRGVGSQLTLEVENITGRAPVAFEQFVHDHAAAFR